MCEALPQRICNLRVCGPLAYCHQKEWLCLPVCVLKCLQVEQRVFGRVQNVGLLDPGLPAGHSHVLLRLLVRASVRVLGAGRV